MTNKEQKIIDYVKYLRDRKERGKEVTYTQLTDIIDIINDKFIPHDCMMEGEEIGSKCLSKIGCLCEDCKDGLCMAKF